MARDLYLGRFVRGLDMHLPAQTMENFDTLGGYVAHTLGHVPRRGQVLQWEGLELRVLLTKGGAVRWFQVRRPEAPATDTAESTPS